MYSEEFAEFQRHRCLENIATLERNNPGPFERIHFYRGVKIIMRMILNVMVKKVQTQTGVNSTKAKFIRINKENVTKTK